MVGRICTQCGEEEQMPKRTICKTCRNSRRYKDVQKYTRYGITKDEYEQILDSQDGVCAICGKVPKTFAIDHDHVTGEVRGVLCIKCNAGAGMFEDNPELCELAAKYLRVKVSA